MSKVILIVAAHTDDETLGCGGTIAKHVALGDTVYAVFLADGVKSRQDATPNDLEARCSASENALEILGIKSSFMLTFPDQRMDTVPMLDIVQKLEHILNEIKPQVIYTHHDGDLNLDHRITHQATLTACRPQPGHFVKEIYSYEVRSATDWSVGHLNYFEPNYYVDISDFWDVKKSALNAYALEMRPKPHSRSVEAVDANSIVRGCEVGLHRAEAFKLLRKIS